MTGENISQKLRLSNTDETSKYFMEEIKQKELFTWKHKSVCKTLNYIEHFLILASMVTRCILFSTFASLVGIPASIGISTVGIKICAITAVIKKYKSIIKNKKKKHDEIVLLAKTKLNNIEVLISKALIDSCISHEEFFIVNNALRECDDKKKEIITS